MSENMHITVAVRCRCRNSQEIEARSPVVVKVPDVSSANGEVTVNTSNDLGLTGQTKTYHVDKVFGPSASQTLIFNEMALPLFDDFIQGFNCSMLVYGMTSSGKTHTMTGDVGETIRENSGVIPRFLDKLFDVLPGDYFVKCSFVELYNEDLRDLLGGATQLKMFESRDGTVQIQNLEEVHVTDASFGMELLVKGLKRRQVASTKMNELSSRSHVIFTVHLYRKINDELVRFSKMNLVDLAGSENVSRAGSLEQRSKETGSINKSLLTLGRVINALAAKNNPPFRESKLTRMLKDSLGGKNRTVLIATISPANINRFETMSTLDYAVTTRTIKVSPQLGYTMSAGVLMKDLANELAKLKRDMLATRAKEGVFMDPKHYEQIQSDLQLLVTERDEAKRELDVYKSTVERKETEAEEFKNTVASLQRENELLRRRNNEYSGNITHLKTSLDQVTHLWDSWASNLVNNSIQLRDSVDDKLTEISRSLADKIAQHTAVDDGEIRREIQFLKDAIEMCIFQTQQKTQAYFTKEIGEIYKGVSSRMKSICDDLDACLNDRTLKETRDDLLAMAENVNHVQEYLDGGIFKNNHHIIENKINQMRGWQQNFNNETQKLVEKLLESRFSQMTNVVTESLSELPQTVIDHENNMLQSTRQYIEQLKVTTNQVEDKVSKYSVLSGQHLQKAVKTAAPNDTGVLQFSIDVEQLKHKQGIDDHINRISSTTDKLLKSKTAAEAIGKEVSSICSELAQSLLSTSQEDEIADIRSQIHGVLNDNIPSSPAKELKRRADNIRSEIEDAKRRRID